MDAPAASVLAYVLWPALTFTIVALWFAAILDITLGRRRGSFTSASLLGVASLVSVVAVVALAGMSAVLAGPWVEAVSGTGTYGMQATELEDEPSSRAYIFSFGLENASYEWSADSTDAKESRNNVPR